MVFDEVIARRILRDPQGVAPALLELRLVIGEDAIRAIRRRRRPVDVGIGEPAERAFADRIVVRAEAAAAAHHVEAVAVFLVRAEAVGRAVRRVPVVRVIAPERVAALVIEHIHSIPAHPHAVAAAPRDAAQPRPAIHPDDRAVKLIRVVAELARRRARVAVDEPESIDLRVLRDIPRLRMRQHHQRRDRARRRHAPIGIFQEVARHIPHVARPAVLRVRRLELIRVGDADVEAAEVADGLGAGARIRVVKEARPARPARLEHRRVLFLQHADVRAIAQPDHPLADLHRRRLIRHRLLRRRHAGREPRHRAQRLDGGRFRNALALLQLPHRTRRDGKLPVDRHAAQGHFLLRVQRHHLPEHTRLEALALRRLEVTQRQLRARRDVALRTPAIHIESARRRHRHLQQPRDLRRQILQDHPRHRLLQRPLRIGRDERLKLRPPLRRQPHPLRLHRRPPRRIRRLPLPRPVIESHDLPKIRLPLHLHRRRPELRHRHRRRDRLTRRHGCRLHRRRSSGRIRRRERWSSLDRALAASVAGHEHKHDSDDETREQEEGFFHAGWDEEMEGRGVCGSGAMTGGAKAGRGAALCQPSIPAPRPRCKARFRPSATHPNTRALLLHPHPSHLPTRHPPHPAPSVRTVARKPPVWQDGPRSSARMEPHCPESSPPIPRPRANPHPGIHPDYP